MGLFSSKKKKVFSTTVERMIDNNSIPDSAKAAVMNYLLSSGGSVSTSVTGKSLPDHLIEATQNALPTKVQRAYRYADKGHYYYGLPKAATSKAGEAVDIDATVLDYLNTVETDPVQLVYAHVGEANHQHFLWKILIDQYGYNPTTNELTVLSTEKGFPCFLTSGQIFFTERTINSVLDSSYFDQWGFSMENGATIDREQDLFRVHVEHDVIEDPLIEDDYAVIKYEYNEIIPDTTPPDVVNVEVYDGIWLKGLTEYGATVNIYDLSDVLITSVVADETGYFEVEMDNPQSDPDPDANPSDPDYVSPPYVYAHPEIKLQVVDTANNLSAFQNVVMPYERPEELDELGNPKVPQGKEPTQTVFKREEEFNVNFLAYIARTIEDFEEDSIDIEEGDVEAPEEPDLDPNYPAPPPEHEYVMVSYTVTVGGVTEIKYLTYIYESGGIPELDNLLDFTEASGEFYPRIYATLNGQRLNRSTLKGTEPYKSSRNMGRRIGIDWSNLVDMLYDGIGGNAGDTKQMFVGFCAPLNTDDEVIQEYLYRFFNKTLQDLNTPANPIQGFDVVQGLSLSVKDNAYNHIFAFSHIGKATVTGSIGDVGSYSSGYQPRTVIGTASGGSGFSRFFRRIYSSPYHYLRYQFSETEYYEIRIFDAKSVHEFSGGGTTVTGTDSALVIPLDRSALPSMNLRESEILFSKCFYMVINVFKVIKTKWYQRGIFKVVMAVVAIVIAVVSVGAGAPMSAYLLAAAYAVGVSVAVSVAVTVLSKLLVKLGVDSGIIAVIAVIIAVIAIFVGAGGSASKLLDVSAKTLLQAANAAFNVASRMNAIELKKIMKQMDEFQAYAKEQWEKIDKAQELLIKGVPLDMELLMSNSRSAVLIHVGETADMYLSRSIGLGNVGALSFDILSTYVDNSLMLPTMYQTMQLIKRGEEL